MTTIAPLNPDSALPLLQKYSFNKTARQQLLLNMGLSNADSAQIQFLQEQVITPNAKRIIDVFYVYLMQLPSMRRFLPEHLSRLKRTQEEYLLSFGVGFNKPDYFEYRLRIGICMNGWA